MDFQEENKPKLTLSPLVVFGFAASVAYFVPVIKSLGFILVIPIAVAGVLYAEMGLKGFKELYTPGKAAKFALYIAFSTTAFTTLIEVILTLIFKDNDFVRALPEVKAMFTPNVLGPEVEQALQSFDKISNDISTVGFSLAYTFFFFFSNVIVNSVAGLIASAFIHPVLNKKFYRPSKQ